jgi:hypothetical protein
MTALRVPARPDEGGVRLRPVPWRRMAGVTWRQHRFALAGVAVLLGGLAVYEWLTGESLHRAWAAAVACHPVGAPACQGPVNAFNYMENFVSLGGPLQLVPALIGAFTGAPVLAREMETGTFRFAWTQGFGRWRWALAKLSGLAVVLALAAGAFGMLVSWHYQPWFAPGNQAPGLTSLSPFYTGLFDLRGLAFPAWTLAAFAIGALAGMLIRRVVPAIVATLAVYAGLAFAAARLLRWRYLTPLVTRNPDVPGSAWILSQWSTKDGRFAFSGFPPGNLLDRFCSAVPAGKGGPAVEAYAQCLARHGYTQWTSYQPASRFWAFQWIEAGWLLALSALLIAVTIWLVRRRAA